MSEKRLHEIIAGDRRSFELIRKWAQGLRGAQAIIDLADQRLGAMPVPKPPSPAPPPPVLRLGPGGDYIKDWPK